MKKVFLLLMYFILCSFILKAQVYNNPSFLKADIASLHISRVEITSDTTYICCTLSSSGDDWANISPDTFIRDITTGKQYKILNCHGLPFKPSVRDFTRAGQYDIIFCFPAIQDIYRFDFIENPDSKTSFNIYDIFLPFTGNLKGTINDLIDENAFAEADSMIDKLKKMYPVPHVCLELDLYKSLIGYRKFKLSSKIDDYKPYCKNGENVLRSNYDIIDVNNAGLYNLWPMLGAWSEVFEATNNCFVDSVLEFSKRYYCDFNQKDAFSCYNIHLSGYNYYVNRGNWNKAIDIMKVLHEALKKDNDRYGYLPCSSFYIGIAYLNMKNEKEAEKYFTNAYFAFQEVSNKDEFDLYGFLLNNISNVQNNQGNFKFAFKYASEAVGINKKIFGDKSEPYVAALTALSTSEFGLNKIEEGLVHAEESMRIIKSVGNIDPKVKRAVQARISLIYNYLNKDNSLSENTEVSHTDTFNDNVILAEAYKLGNEGHIDMAIDKLYTLQKYYEEHFESISLANYITTISSLSNCLAKKGEYVKADNILNKSIEILEEKDIQSDLIRFIYMSKGLLYYVLDNTDKALHWLNLSKNIFDKYDNKSISYGLLLSNISMCKLKEEDFETSKKFANEAYDICMQYYGKNNPNANDILTILNNLATIYAKNKDYDKGKEIYHKILDIAGINDNVKAMALGNLAEIFVIENDCKKAKEYYRLVLNMSVDEYIKKEAISNLLLIKILTKDKEVLEELNKYNEDARNNMIRIFSNFSEAEREEYWMKQSQILLILNNLAAIKIPMKEVTMMAYDNALYTKRMTMTGGSIFGNLVKECKNESAIDNYRLMRGMKSLLANKTISKDSVDFYHDNIDILEKKIISEIPDFELKIKSGFKSWRNVQNMLSDDDVALEFVLLPIIGDKILEAELGYGVLLLNKYSNAPVFIPLCKESELKNLLAGDNLTQQNHIDSLYSISNNSLYNLIWKKINGYIKTKSNIYYSPVGYINRIPMSVISDGNIRIGDKYNFVQVSTTSLIDELKSKKYEGIHSAVLYGDIDYNENIKSLKSIESEHENVSYMPLSLTRSKAALRSRWDLLPATGIEISNIAGLLKEHNINSTIYCKSNATEESFKSLSGKSPDILHIATHGFYVSSINEKTPNFFFNCSNRNTTENFFMSFSGLLFSGGNNTWVVNDFYNDNIEDGILTSDEISDLDFSQSKLIVLSACDTGLGEIDEIDGVYGLQRGFKKAGAGSILMSLWKIPDEETSDLMISFYRYFLSGMNPYDALRQSQKELQDKGLPPSYWAGFIVLD